MRGYEQDLLWWGEMDGDMVNRARLSGLQVKWIDDRTAMLHQWHKRKCQVLTSTPAREAAKRAWRHNHNLVNARARQKVRNDDTWGQCAPINVMDVIVNGT